MFFGDLRCEIFVEDGALNNKHGIFPYLLKYKKTFVMQLLSTLREPPIARAFRFLPPSLLFFH